MKYQGQTIHYPNIEEFDQYDQNQALAAMTRSDLLAHSTKYVGCLTVEDRLLHYIYVKVLKPRGGNYASLLAEDIFMLWAIKQRILINWPHLICQHMMKCKNSSGMPLSYGVLISRIIEFHGIDTGNEFMMVVGYTSMLNKRRLNKLKIVEIDGVWQYAHGGNNEEDDQQQQQQPNEREPVMHADGSQFVSQPSHPVHPYDPNMLQQIYAGVQGLQTGLNNLSITMSDGFQRSDNRFADFTQMVDNRFQTAKTRFDEFVQSVENRFDTFDQRFQDLQCQLQGPSQ